MHQDRADRTASAVELRFQHHAAGGACGHGFHFLQVRGQADHFHQQIQIRFLLGRNIHEYGFTAPFFGQQAAIAELFLDPVGQGLGLINLVDRHDDRHFGGMGVVDGFERLRHHTVIRRDNEHHNIRGFRSAGAHASERFVARGIEEHNLAAISGRCSVGDADLVSTDVLGDSACFALGHIG